VYVSGAWTLNGHGTKIELCFVNGSCAASTMMGRVTGGTTLYSIPWIEFDVSATAPSNSTQAYLRWTVASNAELGYVTFDTGLTPAANGQVTVAVDKMISVDAPALIDFGAGVPGDTLAVSGSTVTVTTNSPSGYTLSVGGAPMTRAGSADSIPPNAISITVDSGPAVVVPPAASPAQIAEADAMTGQAGHSWSLGLSLLVPFVGSGTYQGSLTWVATTK
jgi:hypothetical protein